MNLYCTVTQFGDTVEDEASSAFTAVKAYQVDTTMVDAHVPCTALIHICKTKGTNYISFSLNRGK